MFKSSTHRLTPRLSLTSLVALAVLLVVPFSASAATDVKPFGVSVAMQTTGPAKEVREKRPPTWQL